MMPYDFMFEEDEDSAVRFGNDDMLSADFEAALKEKGIAYTTETIELLGVEGTYEKDVFPYLAW